MTIISLPCTHRIHALGAPVKLKDGRIGWVWTREFSAGSEPKLTAYGVRLTGGRGTVCAKPEDVHPYRAEPQTQDGKGAA